MGGGTTTRWLFVFLVLYSTCFVLGDLSSSSFTPADNYLINCGSPDDAVLDDGRTFKSDPQSASYLSTDEDILTSITSFPNNVSPSSSASSSVLPLYLTARIFHHESMYRFPIVRPGRHWIRLHFYPLTHPSYNLTSATFTITTDDIVLLHGFSVKDSTKMVFREYLINITSDKLTLKFSPMKKSVAFINAIELVSAPDDLISDLASAVSPVGDFNGLNNYAMEVSYRLNVGGPIVTPKNDTLWRTWLPDGQFMVFPEGAKNVSVPTDVIQYPKGGATPLIAPHWVYATADQMADSGTADPNFNLTWKMSVDPSFSYLIRLHFCDIVSKGLNELYFNVYVNGITGVSSLDLSTLTSGLAIPYYKDFVLNASAISNGTVVIQVGPTSNLQSSLPNAILNGLEVMKLSNSAGSLDGLFSTDGTYRGLKSGPTGTMKVAAGIGLALGATALLLLLIGILRWQKRPKGYEKQKTFSSWLLPLNSSQCSFLSSKSKSTTFSSIVNSGLNLGRYFTLNELRDATKNFDEKAVVGVGGFGKVYLGELEDGTKVAIKRGNPSSSQGINEFQTEIQLLSKLRHRHLVSLIGYCDEQSEMILVYEYMAYGPLRDHLYGSTLPPLSWRQRLEVCIGSARGLHYLHTVNLAEFAKQQNAKGCIHKIVDPAISGTITQESLMKYVEAAEKCLAEYGVDRPSMGDVLWHLEHALQLQGTASANSAESAGDDDHESDGKKMKMDVNEAAGKSSDQEKRDEMVVDVSDDSGLVVASPMFLETFQGR
ncbi:putative receptor-like protein kinase [Sesamum alatum]|uniref:Receptor-like protein kinase n=1 Tax=Sesamum alatum TaxID=300844 RepID=A0AAE1YCT3_9LAMI|nr:putative receptor-like protein kinase [Sesamum alatum]